MKKILIILSMAALGIFGLFWAVGDKALAGAGRWLEVKTPLQQADLVVALGGNRARQNEAARLLSEGTAKYVTLMGSDIQERDYHCLGIPAESVIMPLTYANTTQEEARTIRMLVEERGLRSVLIVTSPYHVRRALWTFERAFAGTTVTLFAVSAPNRAFSLDTWWKTHIGRKLVLSEYAALVYYWLFV